MSVINIYCFNSHQSEGYVVEVSFLSGDSRAASITSGLFCHLSEHLYTCPTIIAWNCHPGINSSIASPVQCRSAGWGYWETIQGLRLSQGDMKVTGVRYDTCPLVEQPSQHPASLSGMSGEVLRIERGSTWLEGNIAKCHGRVKTVTFNNPHCGNYVFFFMELSH